MLRLVSLPVSTSAKGQASISQRDLDLISRFGYDTDGYTRFRNLGVPHSIVLAAFRGDFYLIDDFLKFANEFTTEQLREIATVFRLMRDEMIDEHFLLDFSNMEAELISLVSAGCRSGLQGEKLIQFFKIFFESDSESALFEKIETYPNFEIVSASSRLVVVFDLEIQKAIQIASSWLDDASDEHDLTSIARLVEQLVLDFEVDLEVATKFSQWIPEDFYFVIWNQFIRIQNFSLKSSEKAEEELTAIVPIDLLLHYVDVVAEKLRNGDFEIDEDTVMKVLMEIFGLEGYEFLAESED